VLALLLVAWPAPGDAAARGLACPGTGAAPSVRVAERGGAERATRVVLCRAGRARVLDRHVLRRRGPERPPRGSVVLDAALAGDRVAWLVGRLGRGGPEVEVVLARVRDGRVLRRVRHTAPRRLLLGLASVAVTDRGDVAFVVPRDRFSGSVFLVRAGAAARLVGTAPGQGLRFEDGGTLIAGEEEAVVVEVRPPPVVDGCPRRRRFRTQLSTPAVLVTEHRTDGSSGITRTELRACLRGSGRDRVVAGAHSAFGNGTAARAVTARGTALLVEIRAVSRYNDGCAAAGFDGVTLDAPAGPPRQVDSGTCRPVRFADVTSTGSPVVLAPTSDGVLRLLATAPDGAQRVLDAAPDIRDVRVDGARVSWVRDGLARTAEVS
jgi:hypothetical protein